VTLELCHRFRRLEPIIMAASVRNPCPTPQAQANGRAFLTRLKAQTVREKVVEKSRNEGRTHDLIDNRGPILETHDVYENKADISWNPISL
jgi:hypothetical protein